jgi:cytochrome c oxidase assembly protein subunit 15
VRCNIYGVTGESPCLPKHRRETIWLCVTQTNQTKLSNWLFGVALLVFCIVVVGGITRLTESGLSITEWKPLMGALPPLSEAQWLAEFGRYQQIPEYLEINGPAGMTLADFKFIYFWEWIHRLLGRVIGLALALPFLWLALRWILPKGYTLRIFALVMLVGLQGTIGWWMVASGLETRTDVSHFRLSVHLLTALVILGGLIWTALDLKALTADPDIKPARLTGFSATILIILFVQLLLGAWVAGLNAGYVSSSWPLMNDRLVPEGIEWAAGVGYALTHDPYLIHFLHRWWAWVAVAALILMARKLKKNNARLTGISIHSAIGVQILLGIATVVTGMNIVLAVLHQAVGALVVGASVWGAHRLGQQAMHGIKSNDRPGAGIQPVPQRG